MGIDHRHEAGLTVVCAVCHRPIQGKDYQDRCLASERTDEYHEACCPECHPEGAMDTINCRGCRNDYYNGQGAKVCWMLSKAVMMTRYSISMDDPMNEPDNYTEVQRPSCYNTGGYSGDGTWLVNQLPQQSALTAA